MEEEILDEDSQLDLIDIDVINEEDLLSLELETALYLLMRRNTQTTNKEDL